MQKEQENAMDKHTLERKCAMMEYTMYVPPRLRSAGPECRAAGASSCRQWAAPPPRQAPCQAWRPESLVWGLRVGGRGSLWPQP